ncbi:hypothetical protein ACIBQ1_54895 [Nonomuraea sp. NPDC050153]
MQRQPDRDPVMEGFEIDPRPLGRPSGDVGSGNLANRVAQDVPV